MRVHNGFDFYCRSARILQYSLRIHAERMCLDSMMAHYGKFIGVKNYIALVGPKSSVQEERLGYYGEQIVLKAQKLGLNTC